MSFKVLITGGTIDDLDYAHEDDAPDQDTLVPALLKKLNINDRYSTKVVFFKDSRFVTKEDKERLIKECRDAEEDHIIVTHGTMTMTQTAKELLKKKIPKTIILTGAAIPGNQPNTDALDNIKLAIDNLRSPHGVYISMSGKIFPGDKCEKNLKTGVFEPI